jgi:pimeloyl-ACP methyl ester carboxylesterase
VDEIAGYPFEPHRVEFDGLAMSYVDEGEGAPVLLLHGEPTWSFLWRNVIPQLPGRVVAPDLIGFGLSDKPEDVAWYSYDRHVRSIAHLVETLDLREVTLVVHDWGGPIGLRLAVEQPHRVARIAILNTGIGGGPRRARPGSASGRSSGSSAARSTSGGSSRQVPPAASPTRCVPPTTSRSRRRRRRRASWPSPSSSRPSPTTRTRRR